MSQNLETETQRLGADGSSDNRGGLSPVARLAGLLAGIVLGVVLIAAGVWLARPAGSSSASDSTQAVGAEAGGATVAPASWERPVVAETQLAEKVGVEIVYVAVTGSGGLIDLRYRVIDPDKAGSVHDANTPPVILDESTGLVVDGLLMGHSHTGIYNAGQTYYLIFENPGSVVQRGSEVSVLLGNAEVEHVTVK